MDDSLRGANGTEDTVKSLDEPSRTALGPLTGALVIIAWFSLFALLEFAIYWWPFLFFYATGIGGWFTLTIVGLIATSLAFFVGFKFKNAGWILGLCLAVLFLFGSLPWMLYGQYSQYIWTVGEDFSRGYLLMPFILALGACLGYAGSRFAAKRNWRTFHFKSPILSFAPLVLICLAVSVATPFLLEKSSTRPSKVLISPKYHFQVTVPSGWTSWEDAVIDERIKEAGVVGAYRLQFEKYNSKPDRPANVELRISMFDRIPYTDIPIGNQSQEEVFRKLVSSIEQDGMYRGTGLRFVQPSLCEVAGQQALNFELTGYSDPSGGRHADMFVLRSPYIYQLRWNLGTDSEVGEKYQKQILDSFKFIWF